MDKAKFLEAIDIFGQEVVNEVRSVVQLSDPDGAQVLFEEYSILRIL